MTDLDGELEALRRETRKKLDEEADLEKRLAALESPASPEIAPAPAVSQPAGEARAKSARAAKADSDEEEDDDEASRAGKDSDRLAHEAKVKALNLATRAILEGPEAMVKGTQIAKKAAGLSILQKLMAGVAGLIAIVVLWKLVFEPLMIFAIVIGIVAILVMGAAKFFGKDGDADDDDEDDGDDDEKPAS